MKTPPRSLDDIAITVRGYKMNPRKRNTGYQQRMQSLYGSRKFILETIEYPEYKTIIKLKELCPDSSYKLIATRSAIRGNPFSIHRAIKSLEKKAKCRLYYVLLISTDGEYL